MPQILEKPIAPAPKISGVTTTARAARQAAERPASADTLSFLPSTDDLRAALGVAPGTAEADPDAEPPEQTPEEEPLDPEPGEEDAPAEEEQHEEEVPKPEDEQSPEEDAEDALPTTPEEVRALRDGMQKRIDKLTASRTATREELDELKAELEQVRASAPAAQAFVPDQPLGDVLTLPDLDKRAASARELKQWCLRNRNGAEVAQGEGREPIAYDADQVATILANVEQELDAVPQRQQWLATQDDIRGKLSQAVPEFYSKGTPQAAILQKTLAAIPPQVRAWRPDFEAIIVQALVGSQVLAERQQKTAASKTAAGKPAAKPAPPIPGARPAPKAPARAIDQRKSQEQLRQAPTEANLADAIEAKLG